MKIFYNFTITCLLSMTWEGFSQPVVLHGFPDAESSFVELITKEYPAGIQSGDQVRKLLKSHLESTMRHFASIDSVINKGDFIHVYGNQGPPIIIQSIQLNDPGSFLYRLYDRQNPLADLPSKNPEPVLIELTVSRILNKATASGYPFLTITPVLKVVDSAPDTIRLGLTLTVSDTAKVRLNGLSVDGNVDVDTTVIRKIARLREGAGYSESEALTIRKRLLASELFESVELPSFQILNAGDYRWYVKVKEKPPNRFDGILGYAPGEKGKDGVLTGLIDIRLKNFLGNARRLDLFWSRENQWSQDFNLAWTEPWIFDQPWNLLFRFSQRNQDSSFVRQGFQFGADWFGIDNLTLSTIVQTEKVLGLRNEKTKATGPDVLNSSKLSLTAGFDWDNRPDELITSTGYRLQVFMSYGLKTINGPDSVLTPDISRKETVRKSDVQLNSWQELFRFLIWYGAGHYQDFSQQNPEISDLFLIGGINSLRGYRENQFLTSRHFILTNELRIPFDLDAYLFGFIDNAYLQTPAIPTEGLPQSKRFLNGYGFGMVISTPVGKTRFIYALGEGDTFSTGKIHFGLQNEF